MPNDQIGSHDVASLSEDDRHQMLLLASAQGRANVVNELLASYIPKKGGDAMGLLSRVDLDGLSALHHAVLHRHLDAVRLLLRAGAPADLVVGAGGAHEGKTAWGLLPNDEILELDAGADADHGDDAADADARGTVLAVRRVFGAELLQCAALGDVERTQQLLRSGLSPHVRLGTATAGGNDQTVAELALELGGSVLNNPAVALIVDACGDELHNMPLLSSEPLAQQQLDASSISSASFGLTFRTVDSTVEYGSISSNNDDWVSGLAAPTSFVRYHIRVSVEPVGGVAPDWCPFGDEVDAETESEEVASPTPAKSPSMLCPSYLLCRRFREFVELLVSTICFAAVFLCLSKPSCLFAPKVSPCIRTRCIAFCYSDTALYR
jgi:hypothetical protein